MRLTCATQRKQALANHQRVVLLGLQSDETLLLFSVKKNRSRWRNSKKLISAFFFVNCTTLAIGHGGDTQVSLLLVCEPERNIFNLDTLTIKAVKNDND